MKNISKELDDTVGIMSGVPTHFDRAFEHLVTRRSSTVETLFGIVPILAYSGLMTDKFDWKAITRSDMELTAFSGGDDKENLGFGHTIGSLLLNAITKDHMNGGTFLRDLFIESTEIQDMDLFTTRVKYKEGSVKKLDEFISKMSGQELQIFAMGKNLEIDPVLRKQLQLIIKAGFGSYVFSKYIVIFDYITRSQVDPYIRRVMYHYYLNTAKTLFGMPMDDVSGEVIRKLLTINKEIAENVDSIEDMDPDNSVFLFMYDVLSCHPEYHDTLDQILFFMSSYNPTEEITPEFEKILIGVCRYLIHMAIRCIGYELAIGEIPPSLWMLEYNITPFHRLDDSENRKPFQNIKELYDHTLECVDFNKNIANNINRATRTAIAFVAGMRHTDIVESTVKTDEDAIARNPDNFETTLRRSKSENLTGSAVEIMDIALPKIANPLVLPMENFIERLNRVDCIYDYLYLLSDISEAVLLGSKDELTSEEIHGAAKGITVSYEQILTYIMHIYPDSVEPGVIFELSHMITVLGEVMDMIDREAKAKLNRMMEDRDSMNVQDFLQIMSIVFRGSTDGTSVTVAPSDVLSESDVKLLTRMVHNLVGEVIGTMIIDGTTMPDYR